MTDLRDVEILRLMEREELSGRTIAQRLGLSESAVSRAWRRALDRRRLGEDESDDDEVLL